VVAPAIVTLMEHKRLTIAFFGVAANSEFHYSKYFSMISARSGSQDHDVARLL
jgi:hypothetical protein